jgi:hypothetical protein
MKTEALTLHMFLLFYGRVNVMGFLRSRFQNYLSTQHADTRWRISSGKLAVQDILFYD